MMQQYYAAGARRLGLPYPRFIHEHNLDSVDDEDLAAMLEQALEAAWSQYPRHEYTGGFTFVLQPLAGPRWHVPQISPELAACVDVA